MNTSLWTLNDPLNRLYDSGINLPRWKAGSLCLAAGLSCSLGFAPLHLWPAYALALTSLVWMLDGADRFENPVALRWMYSFLFALGLICGGWNWLILDLVDASNRQTVALHTGMMVFQAAGWATVIAVSSLAWRPGPARIGLFCVAFFLAEWMRTLWHDGILWNPAALIWAPGSAMSQIASVIGVQGLSALSIALFAAPMAMMDQRSASIATRVLPLVAVGTCLGVMWGWGAQRLNTASDQNLLSNNQTTYTLRLVDASGARTDDVLRTYLAATGNDNDTNSSTEIVIWPESATEHLLFQSTRYIDPIAQILGNRFLIAGSLRSESSGQPNQRIDYYNSLAVLTADSVRRGPLATHDASRPPPIDTDPVLNGHRIATGLSPVPVGLDGLPPFMPMIGAESLVPWHLPAASNQPAWIVHLTDEQNMTRPFSRMQSFAHARYRSIEAGIPMARVSAGGISAVIDGVGRSVTAISHQKILQLPGTSDAQPAGVQRFVLPTAVSKTLFSEGWGGYFVVFFILFNLSLFAWRCS